MRLTLFRPVSGILFILLGLLTTTARAGVHLDWTRLSQLPALSGRNSAPGVAGPFSGTNNGTLIIAGGANFPQPVWQTQKHYFAEIFVLPLQDGAADRHWIRGNYLKRPLAYGASVSTPHGLLCMGGTDGRQVYADVFLLSWDSNRQRIRTIELPPLPKPCMNGSAAIIGDQVFLAGGQSGNGLESAMKNFWKLDLSPLADGAGPKSLKWRRLPSWPGPERAFNITVAQHNGRDYCLYVMSGRRWRAEHGQGPFDMLKDVYEFSPLRHKNGRDSSSAWKRKHDLPSVVMAGTGAAAGQSHIIIFGGADGSLINRASELKDRHPGFPKKAWIYHTITDTWTGAGPTPVNQVTTRAVPWNDGYIIPAGEVRPRRRTPDIWQVRLQSRTASFGWLNFSTLSVYLITMLLIGFYFARVNKSSDDYFRGGQRIPWWAAGCSIFATMLSSITYMSVPAKAYATNWEYLLGYPAIFISAVFVIWLVLPFFRRLDATSAYEYLEKRFNRATRQIGSALFSLFQIGRMAIVMYLSALALAAVTPFSETEAILVMGLLSVIYSTMGGVSAVIWTDTIQTFVLLGGALLILFLSVYKIDGGLSAFFTLAESSDKFHMINWDWDWQSYTSSAFWVLIVGSLAQNLISYTSDQAVVQRYMTTSSEKQAARSIWTNGIMSLGAGLLFFLLGTALFVFYKQHPAHLDPTFKNDAIMPLFIVQELPVGLAGLLVAGIFAAAQSTISTSMNSTATALVTDFLKPNLAGKADRFYLNMGRLFTFCLGLAGTVFAVLLATADIKSLLDQFFAFIGLFGGSLGGLFLLGLFTTRTSGAAAVIGAIVGAVVLYLVQMYTQTHVYLYAFVGVTSCFISGYLASWLVGKNCKDIDGLTIFALKSTS